MISIEERARVIYDELNANQRADPVAWLAEALRQFEREIRQGASTGGRAIVAVADQEGEQV